MKRKLLLTALSAFLLLSCNSNHSSKVKGTENIVTVDIPSSEANFSKNFDSLFDFRNFVALETNDECLLKKVSKVSFYNKEIYILDEREKKIYVFSNEGKYRRCYSHLGQGPGEYLSLSDFTIKKDTLYILDGLGGKLLQYGLNDSLLKSLDVEKAQGIHVFSNTKFALNKALGHADGSTKKVHYSYVMYDKGNKLYDEVPFNSHLCGYGLSLGSGANSFYTYNDTVYTLFPYNDTIYTIDNERGNLRPYLAAGKNIERIHLDDDKKQVDKFRKEWLIPSIFSFYKWGKHLFFAYSYKKEGFKFVFAEENGDILYHGPLGLDKNRLPIHPVAYDTDAADGCLLSVINSFEVLSIAEKGTKGSNVLNEISNKIQQDDNPVLVFYNVKF